MDVPAAIGSIESRLDIVLLICYLYFSLSFDLCCCVLMTPDNLFWPLDLEWLSFPSGSSSQTNDYPPSLLIDSISLKSSSLGGYETIFYPLALRVLTVFGPDNSIKPIDSKF